MIHYEGDEAVRDRFAASLRRTDYSPRWTFEGVATSRQAGRNEVYDKRTGDPVPRKGHQRTASLLLR